MKSRGMDVAKPFVELVILRPVITYTALMREMVSFMAVHHAFLTATTTRRHDDTTTRRRCTFVKKNTPQAYLSPPTTHPTRCDFPFQRAAAPKWTLCQSHIRVTTRHALASGCREFELDCSRPVPLSF
ncbi:hypothetical protein CDEST_09058 [Colletotrichum destructivum]|uniref:Uncharacterized protein n=1 Tax=Colletotrichum destructivum TaxID=34406 RepID=A0AAX4IL33_9PEZI|nr:hypothetical protein CDEST_09058 [Colletotrichum destructivum]